jgi:hypothetical protein
MKTEDEEEKIWRISAFKRQRLMLMDVNVLKLPTRGKAGGELSPIVGPEN